jgi:hypothetical protein
MIKSKTGGGLMVQRRRRVTSWLGRGMGVLLMVAAAGPAIAASVADVNGRIDSVLGNSALYQTTITAFQQAVSAGNKDDAAAFVRYPIVVMIEGHRTTIRSAAMFVKRYDAIMTPGIIKAITEQKYEDLFVNDQGVMFGDGQAWLDGICLDRQCKQTLIKVITLQDAPAS